MPVQPITYTFQDLSGPSTSSNPFDLNPYKGLIESCNDDPVHTPRPSSTSPTYRTIITIHAQAQIQSRYLTHRNTRTERQRAILLAPDFQGISVDPILVGLVRAEEKRKGRAAGENVTTDATADDQEEEKEEFADHRHNFSFWARPPLKVRELVGEIQKRLCAIVPGQPIRVPPFPEPLLLHTDLNPLTHHQPLLTILTRQTDLWLMPLPSLHMTTLEIFESHDSAACKAMISSLGLLIDVGTDLPYTLHTPPSPEERQNVVLGHIRALAPYPGGTKRTKLVKPLLAYDAAAVALTWVPAAEHSEGEKHGEGEYSGDGYSKDGKKVKAGTDGYTYHHLRRDMWELLSETSVTNTFAANETGEKPRGPVKVKSRYTVPSAHLTITRNINRWDVIDGERKEDGEEGEGMVDHRKVAKFVQALDEVNAWLRAEYWGEDESRKDGIEWIVGEEKGLDCRSGPSWFGGGETVRLGRGF